MVKTTIYLPDQTKHRLAQAAARRNTTEAQLIREAVERLLRDEPAARRPRLGLFQTADPSLAEHVDEALAEGFGRDGTDA